jgi:PHD/YefM family antitoxin component YafN of YafNO toxin-antitoxin module
MALDERLNLREDLVPVSALQSGTSRVLREVEESGRYKVITREGNAVAVLLRVEDFERLQDDASIGRVIRELREADAEIERGQGMSQAQMERELQDRWGKVPAQKARPRRE